MKSFDKTWSHCNQQYKLGWILSGPKNYSPVSYVNISSQLVITGSPPLLQFERNDETVTVLRNFWETESIGMMDSQELSHKVDDNNLEVQVKDCQFESPVFKEDEQHYQVGLPWEDYLLSSNNYHICENRLSSLYNKLKNQPKLLHEYHEIIKEQEHKGIIERVQESTSPCENTSKRNEYITHTPCCNPTRS